MFGKKFALAVTLLLVLAMVATSCKPAEKLAKEKKKHVKGRCVKCKFLDLCAGNFRVRAEAVTGDVWAPDPACYLTDEEIGIA